MTAPTPVTHDLTPADVEAGTWVRMVSTWPDGATVEYVGPVTWVGSGGWVVVAGLGVPGADPDLPATLTHFSRVDPPAPPRPEVPTLPNAVVELDGGERAWLTHDPDEADGLYWRAADRWIGRNEVAARITRVIFAGEER